MNGIKVTLVICLFCQSSAYINETRIEMLMSLLSVKILFL